MLLELPVQSVCPVEPALRAPQGLLERKERRVRKVPRVQPVVMASKAQSVYLVLPGRRVPPGRTVTRERLENQVRREAKPTRENRVPLAQPVFRVPLELLDPLGETVSLVHEVSRVCSDRRATKEPEVSPDLLVPSACRDFLGPQARRVRTATSVPWAPLVHQAPEAPRVPAELMVHKVRPAVWGAWEAWVRRARTERQETPDHLESLALEDPKEREERRERLGHPEPQDHLERRDPLEMMGPRVTLDLLVSLETLDHPESLVSLVPTVEQERRERTERLVNLDLLVHREKPAHLAPLAREDPPELQERRADKERRALRVRLVLRGLRVRPDPSDLRAHPESPAPKVCAESPALSVNKDFLAPPDKTVHLDLWVPLVSPA